MKTVTLSVLCLIVLLLLAACSGGDSGATPRRKAYPRVALYDTVYTPLDSFPVHFEANGEAPRRMPRHAWADIAYPRYGATLHLSAVSYSADKLADEVAARQERMSLNLYGMTAETLHLTSDDGSFESVLLVSRDPIATPLQFLAVDTLGMLVSGAVYMPGIDAASSADSIAPLVSAMERDITHALKKLHPYQ